MIKASPLRQLEKEGLIKKLCGHTIRHTLTDEYEQMSSKHQRIGVQHIIVEAEQFLLVLRDKSLKVGDLE